MLVTNSKKCKLEFFRFHWRLNSYSYTFLKIFQAYFSLSLNTKQNSQYITLLRSPHVHKKARATFVQTTFIQFIQYNQGLINARSIFFVQYILNLCKKNIGTTLKVSSSAYFHSCF